MTVHAIKPPDVTHLALADMFGIDRGTIRRHLRAIEGLAHPFYAGTARLRASSKHYSVRELLSAMEEHCQRTGSDYGSRERDFIEYIYRYRLRCEGYSNQNNHRNQLTVKDAF